MIPRGGAYSTQTYRGQAAKGIPQNLNPTPLVFSFDQTINVAIDSVNRYTDRLTYLVPLGRRARIFSAFIRFDSSGGGGLAAHIEVLRYAVRDITQIVAMPALFGNVPFKPARIKIATQDYYGDGGATQRTDNNNGYQDLFQGDTLIFSTWTINSGIKRISGYAVGTEFDHK